MTNLPSIPTPVERNVGSMPSESELLAHDTEFNAALWRQKQGLGSHPDVQAVCDRFPAARLTRQDLFDFSGDVVAAPDDLSAKRRLMIATFMWGYGTQGRAYIWAPKALRSDRLAEVLDAATRCVTDGDIVGAYKAFSEPHLSGYNWGFFTKFLYFLGEVGRPEGSTMPLILDSRVQFTLNAYEESFEWEPQWPRGAAKRYDHYCRMLEAWARSLGLVRADQIELFLFGNPPGQGAPELLKVAAAALRVLDADSTDRNELDAALGQLPDDLRAELNRRAER